MTTQDSTGSQDSTDNQASAAKQVGVIVVHGVGEAELGYSVSTLVYALQDKSQGYTVVPHSEVIRLEEEEQRTRGAKEKQPDPQLFRVVRRRAKHASGFDMVLEELYWADLTSLAPGRVNSLMAMFQLIFESHHFVDAMLDKTRGFGTRVLRWLLLAASWFMRGPIAALTISASLVCALLLYGPSGESNGTLYDLIRPPFNKFILVQAVLFGLAIWGVFRAFQLKRVAWYDLVFWLGVVGFFTCLALAWEPTATASFINAHMPDFGAHHMRLKECVETWKPQCYVNVPYVVIILGWLVWGLVIGAAILLAVLLIMAARSRGDRKIAHPIFSALGVIVLQFMLWTIIVVTIMFPMLNRGELMTGLSYQDTTLVDPSSTSVKKATVDLVRERIACDRKPLPDALDSVCDLMESRDLMFEWIPRFKFVYAATAIAFLVAIAIMLLVLARRWQLSRRHAKQLKNAGDREAVLHMEPEQLPRLVFSRWLLIYLLVAVVALIFMIYNIEMVLKYAGDWRGVMLSVAAIAALGFPLLAGHRIANVIHIARDLLDHHYNPNLESAYFLFRWHFRLKSDKPRRHRIQSRLQQMLNELVKGKRYDAIVFVGHSQGTIVAFDYLAREEPLTELGNASLGFVTFGSPIGNLYEQYFHEYSPETDKVERVESRVVGWTNLTRVDDYIGGRIAHSRSTLIDNQTLGRGGHTNYWPVQDIVNAIDRMILLTVNHATEKARSGAAPRATAPAGG